MRCAVLSDIHGNLSALEAVMNDLNTRNIDKIILLGDLIDYGPRSNETVKLIAEIDSKIILANIWGNHENAVINKNFSNFSSERGAESAKFTSSVLNSETARYINALCQCGFEEFEIDELKCLAVHGSLNDPFWKSIFHDNINGNYEKYNYVFSGHSHISHYFSAFRNTDQNGRFNTKATRFINPGSVGQPRNCNPNAQYVVLDTSSANVEFRAVKYDVKYEQEFYKNINIDKFYCDRLEKGV